MLIPWQTYYQNNKHLPLNKIMEQYARVVRDFNEQMAAMSSNAAPGAGVGGADAPTTTTAAPTTTTAAPTTTTAAPTTTTAAPTTTTAEATTTTAEATTTTAEATTTTASP